MAASDIYTDCFWCGLVYDIYRHTSCPGCGSHLQQNYRLGGLAGEFNKRPDYNGPDFTDQLAERQARITAREQELNGES